MSCCGGNPEDEQSSAIDKKIAADKKTASQTSKLLLLGAGECGKTTVMKQLRLLHGKPFTQEELVFFAMIIQRNIVESIQALVEATADEEITKKAQPVLDIVLEDPLCPDLLPLITELWKNEKIQEVWQTKRSTFIIIDNANYFLDDAERAYTKEYVPTTQDVLNCRIMTTGINETQFQQNNQTFHVVDVGGQRSERKKWIHQFDSVSSVIFVTSLADYDQSLREDVDENRTKESIKLFKNTINSDVFFKIPIILFLNKVDLFQEKIKVSPLTTAFPDYQGGNDEQTALDYIVKQYTDQNENNERTVYHHVTHATDTKAMGVIWASVSDIVTRAALKDIGLL